MTIEEEIFKKSSIVFDKLISYGFIKDNNIYQYTTNILDNSFRVEITINYKGIINGKVIDNDFDEEYTNFRVKGVKGDFASQVLEAYQDILIDIKDKCTKKEYFNSPQTNRISQLIYNQYHDVPEFLWEDDDETGVFRNPHNGKWYGIVMYINQSKLDNKTDKEVEILNIKLDDKVNDLLNKDGYYRAYHMNKDKWLSIILDETLDDEEIMQYIKISHQFAETIDEWIIPANPKYYDMIHCFDDKNMITWKQTSKMHVGDIVYMYVTKPIGAILYKCQVMEVDIPFEYQDKNLRISKIMKLQLLQRYNKDQYTFEVLNQYDIKAIRGPRRMSEALRKAMND
ncbi:MAG: MmcQ/YjbR family DNA-binding protein [Erysipelotrichaceae bacterium]|nr:MmcQ/YjbR family DNA-binding protein [Erysipelotrichaceae bacterium]